MDSASVEQSVINDGLLSETMAGIAMDSDKKKTPALDAEVV